MRSIAIPACAIFILLAAGTIGLAADKDVKADLSGYYGFSELEIIKLNWGLKCLRTVDLNRDGLIDIVAINNKDSKIEILLQKAEPSAGTSEVFDSNEYNVNDLSTQSRFAKAPVPVSIKMASLVVGDLNGDTFTDIAFYGEPAALYVMLQENKDANDKKSLAWKPLKKIRIDDGMLGTNTLECGDINNDGRSDLILAGNDSIYMILQKDDGTLAEAVKYPTTAKTLALRLGDLNGDKRVDLILITDDSERPLHVRFGQANGRLGPEMQFKIDMPSAIDVRDFDKAGMDKLLTVDARSGRFCAYKYISDKTSDDDYHSLVYPLPSGKETVSRDLVIADVDGDGLTDVVVSDPAGAQICLYRQVKGLGLDEPVQFGALANITSLSAADVDRDKKDEIAVLSVKEKSIGISRYENKRLTFPRPLPITGEPQAMQLADINADGKTDCVYVSRDTNDVRWLRATYTIGDNAKTFQSKPLAELKSLTANPEGLCVFDADHDGLADVLVFAGYEEPVFIRQESKGVFKVTGGAAFQSSLIKDAKPGSVALANIDGKSGDELLVAGQNFARSLTFTDNKWNIVDQYNAKSTENTIGAVAAFDIDGDSEEEILLVDGQKGQLQVLKPGKDKTFRFDRQIDINNWNIKKILFAPLTGSKESSIVLFDSEKFALVTPARGNGRMQQLFNYETTIKDGRYVNLACGDINSDGKYDFILVEYKRNHLEILTVDGHNEPIPATRFKVFEQKSYRQEDERRGQARAEPGELTVADVSGDGKADIVTITHDRIIIYPQD